MTKPDRDESADQEDETGCGCVANELPSRVMVTRTGSWSVSWDSAHQTCCDISHTCLLLWRPWNPLVSVAVRCVRVFRSSTSRPTFSLLRSE